MITIFLTLLAIASVVIGIAMARGYVLTPPDVKIKKQLAKQNLKELKAKAKKHISTNMSAYRGHPEWGDHSSHTTMQTPVVADGKLVAWICSCGAQLPPQLFCDPDGYIVDVSWDPVEWRSY